MGRKKILNEKTLNQSEVLSAISNEWNKWTKNDDSFHGLYWEIDILTILYVLRENIPRLINEGNRVNNDFRRIVLEAHWLLRVRINKQLISKYSPSLLRKIRALYSFDKSTGQIKFRSSNEKSLTRLKTYVNDLLEIFDARKLLPAVSSSVFTSEEYKLLVRYILKSLTIEYHQTDRAIKELFDKRFTENLFLQIENEICISLTTKLGIINKKSSSFINAVYDETFQIGNQFIDEFSSKILTGQTTEQKDYVYGIYRLLFDEINNSEPEAGLKEKLIESFFLITMFAHLSKTYHNVNTFADEKRLANKKYLELLDLIDSTISSCIRFLKDYTYTIKISDLPAGIKSNTKKDIVSESPSNKVIYNHLRNDLWYKLIRVYSKQVSSDCGKKIKNFTSPKLFFEVKNTYTSEGFVSFKKQIKFIEQLELDFKTFFSSLSEARIDLKMKSFSNDLLLKCILSAIVTGYSPSFVNNIDVGLISPKMFTKVLKSTLNSFIPHKEEFRVITPISHIDMKGLIKKVSKNCYIYDSIEWDSGENNVLDFFAPTNFAGKREEYAVIKFGSPFFFMASNNQWGEKINPNLKMVRHSCRLCFDVKAYSETDAVSKCRTISKKVKNLLVLPWTVYTNTQSANVILSNIYFWRDKDYSKYNSINENRVDIFDEKVLSIDTKPYQILDKFYLKLLNSNNELKVAILDSINYWQNSMWEKDVERKFFYLIKALSSLMGKDLMDQSIGSYRYISLLGNAYRTELWRWELGEKVKTIHDLIMSDPIMKHEYKKLSPNRQYYLDTLKLMNNFGTNSKFTKIGSDINSFTSNYDNNRLKLAVLSKQRHVELDLVIWRSKRHSIIHHDTTNAYDLSNMDHYLWKLNKTYRSVLTEILNIMMSSKVETFKDLLESINIQFP